MKSWQPASREFVRIFYAKNQHIAVVTGRKPRHCSEVDLIPSPGQSGVPTFSIVGRGETGAIPKEGADPDRYYLVKPLLVGPAQSHIRVRHVGGTERVTVEKLGSKTLFTGRQTNLSRSTRSEALAARGSALGYSQNFSMDEAFNDALAHLPAMEHEDLHRTLTLVDVVSMGVIYGGFSGFSRLFVKVEQSRAAMPANMTQKRMRRRRTPNGVK